MEYTPEQIEMLEWDAMILEEDYENSTDKIRSEEKSW